MIITQITNNSDSLIKERIGYIFASFQKEFPDIEYREYSDIVGIGEPNKYLLCYFKVSQNGNVFVKFKDNYKPILLTENINYIDNHIDKTIELFKNYDLVFKKNYANWRKKEIVISEKDFDELLEEMVLTKGETLFRDIDSTKFAEFLYKLDLKKIDDLKGWTYGKLASEKNLSDDTLKRLYVALARFKQRSIKAQLFYFDVDFLHRRATKGRIEKFSQNAKVKEYLESIRFDENQFGNGTIGRVLCLRGKAEHENDLCFCEDKDRLYQAYLDNKDKYKYLFDNTKTLLVDILNRAIYEERDRDIVFSLFRFDDKNCTLADLGKKYGITRQAVSQIFNKSILKMAYSINLHTETGILLYNLRGKYFKLFENCPIDAFMLYLHIENRGNVLKAFNKVVLHDRSIPKGLLSQLEAFQTLKTAKHETLQEMNISFSDALKTIFSACVQMSNKYYFGATTLVDVLKGSQNKKMIERNFHELACFGALKFMRSEDIRAMIDFLVNERFFYKQNGFYPNLIPNEERDIYEIDNLDLTLIDEIIARNKKEEQTDKNIKTVEINNFKLYVNENGEMLTDMDLLKRLQTLRKMIANNKSLPHYCIASNKLLVELATKKPTTGEEFLSIKGIGKNWFSSFGQDFMKEIEDYLIGNGQTAEN